MAQLRKTQFSKFTKEHDPCIGVGNAATSMRLAQPCFTEYGISSFL
jgi:hypothetical protein